MYVAYQKVFRYIFKLLLRAHITELLEVFGVRTVRSLYELVEYVRVKSRNLDSRFEELRFLTQCNIIN